MQAADGLAIELDLGIDVHGRQQQLFQVSGRFNAQVGGQRNDGHGSRFKRVCKR
jgi:hypothetical protein